MTHFNLPYFSILLCFRASILTVVLIASTHGYANTINAPSNDTDGTFTISWTSSTYVELQEYVSSAWTLVEYDGPTGSSTVTRAVGSHTFRIRACTVFGSRYGTSTTCVNGPSASVVVGPIAPINSPPTISNVGNQTVSTGQSTGSLSFTVNDNETSGSQLSVTASSSNLSLVPVNNIAISTSGNSRTISLTPAGAQTGTASITLTVSDGSMVDSSTFVLTVSPYTGVGGNGVKEIIYLHTDLLGTPVAETNENGDVQ